jgi:hypothetical protein
MIRSNVSNAVIVLIVFAALFTLALASTCIAGMFHFGLGVAKAHVRNSNSAGSWKTHLVV